MPVQRQLAISADSNVVEPPEGLPAEDRRRITADNVRELYRLPITDADLVTTEAAPPLAAV